VADRALTILMREQEGRIYPAWRLLLHIIPPIARRTSWGGKFLVCSEIYAKYLYIVHIENGWTDRYGYKWPRHKHFTGANPDMLCDEAHRWSGYRVVFEDTL